MRYSSVVGIIWSKGAFLGVTTPLNYEHVLLISDSY